MAEKHEESQQNQKNNKLNEFEKNKTKQTTAKSDDLRYPNADDIYE